MPVLPVETYAALAFDWVLSQHELNLTPNAVVKVIPTPDFDGGYTLIYEQNDQHLAIGTYIGTALGGIVTLISAKTPSGEWHDYNREDHFCGVDASSGTPKHVRLQAPQPA
ncbi:MAG: hypothetical protein WA082_03465 [Candidatus Moraniibacteriota bacterium]